MILIVDNYDSFVYNIVHYLNIDSDQFEVQRNDIIDIDCISEKYDGIIISPGPMTPTEAGKSLEIVKKYYKSIPILGICLGMECIGIVFGGQLNRCPVIKHGKADYVRLSESKLYLNLSPEIKVARYHSLYVDCSNIDKDIVCNASLLDGSIVMGIEHTKYPLYGVQFHPESLLTGENGKKILNNFLQIISEWKNKQGNNYEKNN